MTSPADLIAEAEALREDLDEARHDLSKMTACRDVLQEERDEARAQLAALEPLRQAALAFGESELDDADVDISTVVVGNLVSIATNLARAEREKGGPR